MINSEQQGLLSSTNPFSVNYGTHIQPNTTILQMKTINSHIQPSNARLPPKPKKISCGFYTLLQIVYITTTLLIIVGFLFEIGFQKFQQQFMTAILISVTISSLYSCYGLIKFGTTLNQISRMKMVNQDYKHENKTLKKTTNQLKNEISYLQVENQTLTQNLNVLKEQEIQYSHIITELEKMAKSEEEIMNIVDYSNKTLESMRMLIEKNQRAYLLHKFYQVLPKGTPEYVAKTTVMNEQQFERFLHLIIEQWRDKFKELGSNIKEIWDCKEINVEQYLRKVDKIIGVSSDMKLKEFRRTYSTISAQFSAEIAQDTDSEEKKTFVPSLLKRNDMQPDIIKKIRNKSLQLEASFDELTFDEAVNIAFVDMIDDRHRKQIQYAMEIFRNKTRSLKRMVSVHLSQDDMHVETLRRELNVQQQSDATFGNVDFLKISDDDSKAIYVGVYGKKAD